MNKKITIGFLVSGIMDSFTEYMCNGITLASCSLPDVPTILIATRIDGYPGVSFDNKYGIREGLEYLINELGVKNVCMMGGSETFNDAVALGLYEVMKERGLEPGRL